MQGPGMNRGKRDAHVRINQIVVQVVPRIKAVVVSVVDTNGPPRPFVIFAERVVRARFLAEVLEHVAPAVEVAAPV